MSRAEAWSTSRFDCTSPTINQAEGWNEHVMTPFRIFPDTPAAHPKNSRAAPTKFPQKFPQNPQKSIFPQKFPQLRDFTIVATLAPRTLRYRIK
jgi:hypothetical protein